MCGITTQTVINKKVLSLKIKSILQLTYFAYKFQIEKPLKLAVTASIHNSCRIICEPNHTYFILIKKGILIVLHHHDILSQEPCIITLKNYRDFTLPLEVRSFLSITQYLTIEELQPTRKSLFKYDKFITFSPILHLQTKTNNFYDYYTKFSNEKLTIDDSFYKKFMQIELKKKLITNHICIYQKDGIRVPTLAIE